MNAHIELFGTRSCPYTGELREQLVWEGQEFVEYDVEGDSDARRRLLELTHGDRAVPVLVQDGRIVMIGWRGRCCTV